MSKEMWRTSKYRILNRLRQGPATANQLVALTNSKASQRERWLAVAFNVRELIKLGHQIKHQVKRGGRSIYTLTHDAQQNEAKSFWATSTKMPSGYPVVKEKHHHKVPAEEKLHEQDGPVRVIKTVPQTVSLQNTILSMLIDYSPDGVPVSELKKLSKRPDSIIYMLRYRGHEISSVYRGPGVTKYKLVKVNTDDLRLQAVHNYNASAEKPVVSDSEPTVTLPEVEKERDARHGGQPKPVKREAEERDLPVVEMKGEVSTSGHDEFYYMREAIRAMEKLDAAGRQYVINRTNKG